MDLGTIDEEGALWNFDNVDKRNVIREYVKAKKPLMIVGSLLQAVTESISTEELETMSEGVTDEIDRRNKEHHNFLAEIYETKSK